ncbi:fungal-specific transcription factor domain-containing protein [Sporodiniella umbellata]|nr:fungal-specific transcription factor domain-containing protein [Sporodiniella umbellata]
MNHHSNSVHRDSLQDSDHLPKKDRVTRACDICRRKKIKCDVDSNQPCATCRHKNQACTFNDVARKRGPQKGYIENLENRLKRMEGLLQNIADKKKAEQRNNLTPLPLKRKREDLHTSENAEKVTRYHGSSSGYHLVTNMFSLAEGSKPNVNSAIDGQIADAPYSNGEVSFHIKKLGTNDDDLMVVRDQTEGEGIYLAKIRNQEEIESVLPRPVMLKLIEIYFSSPPLLPIVDQDEFMDILEGRASTPLSPILIYAVCAYACFLIQSDHPIFKATFVKRDEIFHRLLERGLVLARTEYLVPRVPTIQAFLLFVSLPVQSDKTHMVWILAGMAVRMAQDLGLHRTIKSTEDSVSSKRRKRLWYSVYVTDRWCCTVLGRPLAIADSDCDVELSINDRISPTENLLPFLNFVKLSSILGDILRRLYSPISKTASFKIEDVELSIESLKKKLDAWYTDVPEDCKLSEADLWDLSKNPDLHTNTVKVTQGGPLTVCYYVVLILLHRPFVAIEKSTANIPFIEKCTIICSSAAKLCIQVAQVIPSKSLVKFGWNSAGYSVFFAGLFHAFNTKNSDPKVADEAKEYLRIIIDQILDPMLNGTPNDNYITHLLRTLPDLIGRPKSSKVKKQDPLPMSMQHILSDCEEPGNDTEASNRLSTWLFDLPEPSFWQSLFSNSSALISDDILTDTFGNEGK